ncbi:MAG: FAD-dependent monooxygenase [Flavobacteriales bacterium]|nr:FAD-dependent monooxygenase [Flavobacteriales bacterium]MCB9192736.1 FAD-dependent monooxygenase [Flavobacteriales bacterium]MCB9204906.1 FAD-dependent monooxygenase [Flavobacteriales bacterium]
MAEKQIIIGAGLVGSLHAVYLAKRGVQVEMFERRPDMRTVDISAGRSINLAISHRGLKALNRVGLKEKVLEMVIPMPGRMIHDVEGNTNFQPYGKQGQHINSVSRGGLNALLMTEAEKAGVKINFNQRCISMDLDAGKATFRDEVSGEVTEAAASHIYGTDGAFSEVRHAMMMTDRFDYSQTYLKHGYKELSIPAAEGGGFRIEKNALHIWPRGGYMLIALPNLDGSFTVTLFLAFEGKHAFENLNTEQQVLDFFNEVFPDVVPHMPTLVEDFFGNPTSSLCTVRCFPWRYKDKALIFGDASHAIVPFYGQGMVSGFEDCFVFDQLADEHWNDKETLFDKFQYSRKPDDDAIADLALRNFVEMRDSVADPRFLLRKQIEKKLSAKHPDQWTPLYEMVTFSEMRYSEALARGKEQDKIMEDILSWDGIESNWENPDVFKKIEEKALG